MITATVPRAVSAQTAGFKMRPYQVEAKRCVDDGWSDEIWAQLLVMGTGLGKTVAFCSIAADNEANDEKTLILAHTDELVDQAIKKYENSTGKRAAKEKAGSYASRFDKVVVASVQTLSGMMRLSTWAEDHFDYVVVDEAHRALADSYQVIIKKFCGKDKAKLLGVTATADRGDKQELGVLFQRIAFEYSLRPGVIDGWLVKPYVMTMPLTIDLRGVARKGTANGVDVDVAQVAARLLVIMDAIAKAIKAKIGTGKILIFMPTVETSRILSDVLNANGVTSNWVCGDKKLCPDRRKRVADHQEGKYQALVNFGVLTEGYDDDAIDFICSLRATEIRSLYQQIIGRGTRPHDSIVQQLNDAPDAKARLKLIAGSCKPKLIILDFLWNHEKHKICSPASLFTDDMRVVSKTQGIDGDIMQLEERAERDVAEQLAKELRKNQRKEAMVIDPLEMAEDSGIARLAPMGELVRIPISTSMEAYLRKIGIDPDFVTSQAHALRIKGAYTQRMIRGLCSFRQITFFKKLGIDANNFSASKAGMLMKNREELELLRQECKRKREMAEGEAST